MEKISLDKFNAKQISNEDAQNLSGALKPLKTEAAEGALTDVHHDNDNDGTWSEGDTLIFTRVK